MNIPCSSHTMENVNGELTVFGGGSLRPLDSLENLIGNSWQLEEMEYPHSLHASVLFTLRNFKFSSNKIC